MADVNLSWLPATELAALIRRKKVSPVEVVDAVLDRVARINPRLNAFVTLTEEPARRDAKAAERARRLDVLRLADRQHARADHAGRPRHDRDRDRDDHVVDRGAERRRHHQRQHEQRQPL